MAALLFSLRSSLIARVKKRPSMAALSFSFALVPDRENQKASVHGRTFIILLRSSLIARVKKRPSMAALFNSPKQKWA
jgi:hypothetical protein